VNIFAVYLFYPLPLVLAAALICRSPTLGVGFVVAAVAFGGLWGRQFLPGRWLTVEGARAAEPGLTVMTYNVLAYQQDIPALAETIRAEDADLVLIQELTPGLARHLEGMKAAYPYQDLHPLNSASGIGVISKYPLRPVVQPGGHSWIGGPQVLDLDWNGTQVRVINFHMYPTLHSRSSEQVARDFRIREEQAAILADLAAVPGLVIMGGDANSAPLSDAYRILTRDLRDSWRSAGFGLGHTFPGKRYSLSRVLSPRSPLRLNLTSPLWLTRIDYIFHSPDLRTTEARLARADGSSDHRGVVATLHLRR
jgi:endonuclease/exonuclease/phosphatase (EEP) superfamily protein YafD